VRVNEVSRDVHNRIAKSRDLRLVARVRGVADKQRLQRYADDPVRLADNRFNLHSLAPKPLRGLFAPSVLQTCYHVEGDAQVEQAEHRLVRDRDVNLGWVLRVLYDHQVFVPVDDFVAVEGRQAGGANHLDVRDQAVHQLAADELLQVPAELLGDVVGDCRRGRLARQVVRRVGGLVVANL